MTNANDLIEAKIYRQIGDNEYRIANEKDIRDGMYLSAKGGLTKREYFAAMALQGVLAKPIYIVLNTEYAAGLAVKYADALINALNETK